LLSIACAISAVSSAQVIWDENVHGDISGDRLNPDFVTLSAGSNFLMATSGPDDREYIRLDVPVGFQLNAIILESYQGLDEVAFIGVQAGTVFTEEHIGTDPGNLLGWTLFGPAIQSIPSDILDDMSVGAGAIGFTPPLSSGPYTYWIQQTGDPATYRFDFQVAPVPEPASMAALGIGTLALLRRRKSNNCR
jgi:hypothetical protein